MEKLLKELVGESVRIKIIVDSPHKHELSFSVSKEPISNEDWVEIFEGLIKGFRAKDMPDPDVLGKYSPDAIKSMKIEPRPYDSRSSGELIEEDIK